MKYVIINLTKDTGIAVNDIDSIRHYLREHGMITVSVMSTLLSGSDAIVNGNTYRIIDIDKHNENLKYIHRTIPGLGNDSLDILLKEDNELIDKSYITRRLVTVTQEYDRYISTAINPSVDIITMFKDRINNLNVRLSNA